MRGVANTRIWARDGQTRPAYSSTQYLLIGIPRSDRQVYALDRRGESIAILARVELATSLLLDNMWLAHGWAQRQWERGADLLAYSGP